MLNIGLLGLGTVGGGVLDILQKNADILKQRTGKSYHVSHALVRNLTKKRANTNGLVLTDNPQDIIGHPDIDLVIEVMGGEAAYPLIKQALQQRKHVVTANKEVVSKYKIELIALARENGVGLFFEAAVGGSIPIVQSLKIGYSANRISAIYGILNGTTNFILTKIEEEQKDFDVVLKEAQDLGFAEADPTMDISGLDAAYKLDILAAVAFKVKTSLENIHYEGIETITLTDILYAKQFGYRIKLLAVGRRSRDNRLCFKVHPCLIPMTHPLASVRNEYNALFIAGDAIGEAMLYGKGAGSEPTASAVISDVIDLACHHLDSETNDKEEALQDAPLCPIEESFSKFYVRLHCEDHHGVMAQITQIFSDNQVSLLSVVQKGLDSGNAELVVLTHEVKEHNMNQAISALKTLDAIKALLSVFRVELEG